MLFRDLSPTHQKSLKKLLQEHIELERERKKIYLRNVRVADNRIKILKDIIKSKRGLEHYVKIIKSEVKSVSG